MRSTLFSLLLVLLISCGTDSKTSKSSMNLNGTWLPVEQEFGGKALPKGTFEDQKLMINDSTYVFRAESEDKGAIYYKDGKMDIYGRQGVNTGRHFMAIYKFENEQLIICYNIAGDGYPAAFETKSKPNLFLSVYKKQ